MSLSSAVPLGALTRATNRVQQAYLLYEPLLKAGYRLLRALLLLCGCYSSIFIARTRLHRKTRRELRLAGRALHGAFPPPLHVFPLQRTDVGVRAQLRLIRSPYQHRFRTAPDAPWSGRNATVRAIGGGAGDFTCVLMGGAGHFVRPLSFFFVVVVSGG